MNSQAKVSNLELENSYLLLTPGPLSTSNTVRSAMLRDWCTWDNEYNHLVQGIRHKLVELATTQTEIYTAVLMQGSGSFSVEAVLGSVVPHNGKLLVINNGAYGARIVQMARCLNIAVIELKTAETDTPDLNEIERLLEDDSITHVACVHCETTTGILNPIEQIGRLVKAKQKVWIVDAMSSFAGVPMDIAALEIDFLISSANKCIQGVPGFGFVIAKKALLEQCQGRARSVSLDLYDQWFTMEENNGKWRFTSPTHVVRAFDQALIELEQEGGIEARHQRYVKNQQIVAEGMRTLGFKTILSSHAVQSPIISTFLYPKQNFNFKDFYEALKRSGFVIYPGKVSSLDCFRIGNIGEVYPADMQKLLTAIQQYTQNSI